ncbi:hypothetical protein SVIOM74S_04438 [Streptomyces violarus]
MPGDEAMEQRITAWNRWNAAAMVTRGSNSGVGGHIATFASAAWLYETGFNHFFKGKEADGSGDQLYIQGHASPGIYARAFLDGRLNEEQLDNFRRESGGNGLPSYPHPRRLPWLWEFPTVSMGLGPLSAIYQARFNRYLTNRGIKDTSASHVWAFLGDGEIDEPESTAALALAAREELDNLTFVINCNLQRLDGPVRANFKIVQELEAQFRGAGWNVIKTLWGTAWKLFRLDTTGALVRRLRQVPDAQIPTYRTRDAAYIRQDFFGGDPALAEMAKLLSDDKILECFHFSRGGHEARKVYAAYKAAVEHKGAPTVILAQTVKGHTLGEGFASKNANHQMKKLTVDEFKNMRDLLGLPIKDSDFVDGVVPYRPPGRRLPRGPLPPGAACRPRRSGPGPPRPPGRAAARPGGEGVRLLRQGLRLAERGHHHGVRPPGEGPGPRQGDRQALGADRPGRGAHLRYGEPLPVPGHLLAQGPDVRAGRPRPADVLQGGPQRPDPQRGDHRGRFDGRLHRRFDVVRDARRDDDPVLHLLLHVRLAAHGRPDVAARRPARHAVSSWAPRRAVRR